MSIEIMQFDEEAIWYAPDIGDNRQQCEDDRFAVLIKPATAQQLRRMEERHGKVTRGKMNFTRRYNAIRAEVISTCVLEIRNLFMMAAKVDGSRERREVKDPIELAKVAGEPLLEDIMDAIKDQSLLEDGLLGKSDSPSASSS
jgi:hypothetical protein